MGQERERAEERPRVGRADERGAEGQNCTDELTMENQ